MSQSKRRVHLFNCDNTCKLEPVEKLLEKCSIHVECVEKHSFRLTQMSEMVDKIPTLEMNMAFFVVHAHESRLSINEDNAGIGYAKIYRALLRATGGDVIIVIGGDDSYKGDDEENREVISRWAKKKVTSQFDDEYLDGRKSFIFSWNKQHREIHEQALLHHFDPNKKGKMFEYQPPRRKEPPKAATPPAARSKQVAPQLLRCYSESTKTQFKPKQKEKTKQKEKPTSFQHHPEAVVGAGQAKDEKAFTYLLDSTTESSSIWRDQENRSTTSKQGAWSNEIVHQSSGKTRDLAVLGCNLSQASVKDVQEVLKKVHPIFNLSEEPTFHNLQTTEVKEFLRDNRFRSSVLVVEGYKVVYGYDNQELLQLVKASVERVVEKVIILVCNVPSTSANGTYNHFIQRVNEIEKTFVVEVNNGKLALDPEVLYQVLSPSLVFSAQNTQFISQERDVNAESLSPDSYHYPHKNFSEGKSVVEKGAQNYQQLVWASQFQAEPPPVVVLRSFVRRGKISRLPDDLQVEDPDFTVPYDIERSLSDKYARCLSIGVRIIKFRDGQLRCCLDPNLKQFKLDGEVNLNGQLVLKTRVIEGKVSFEDENVHYKRGNLLIPEHIFDDLLQRKANGDLYILLNYLHEFESVVKTSGILGQATNFVRSKGKAIAKSSRSLFLKDKENC